ncbi:NADPH-dependent FMN reductase [Thalassospira lucentensis]|uniref:NADPH-dependent FMN reductase n=1 Tax=Thalassospira lucentensis TaxID=168935 RepID=UPI003D2B7C98
MPRHVLAICGSLRATSINRTLLHASQMQGLKHALNITLYDGLGDLPIFNPDNEQTPPKSVLAFRAQLSHSDAILIASPEYAHGVTGAIKNALDWVVASGEFMQMPVAAINASGRATIAQAALIETIRTMDATIIDDACVTIVLNGKNYSTDDIINDPETARLLDQALGSLRKALDESDQKRDIA